MAERTSEMRVRFTQGLRCGECARRLGLLGNPVTRTVGRTFTVTVPDGTQWEWANRYMKLPGVETVDYKRPLAGLAPN